MTFPTHPEFDENKERWERLQDCFDGEDAVKAKGIKYLPATPGQILDGMSATCTNKDNFGYQSYQNYKRRARFPDFYGEGVKTLVGIMNEKPAKIVVPERMNYIFNSVTRNNENVHTLLRKIHFAQLTMGRGGLLAELGTQKTATPQPYLELYEALKIINWDDGRYNDKNNDGETSITTDKTRLNMVVLDESGSKRKGGFTWEAVNSYRVLSLGSLQSQVDNVSSDGETYHQYVVESDTQVTSAEEITPQSRDKPLTKIPFTFFGPLDLDAKVDQPPLDGLAILCLHIYMAQADYRQTLFMQAQETLVVVGGIKNAAPPGPKNTAEKEALRVGADSRIDVGPNGDAKYIGVSSKGLSEMRVAIENDNQLAAVRTGQLLAPGKMSMESGEALKTRVAGQTATLTSVAVASALALERALQDIALWLGEDPAKVKVEPNLDFSNYRVATQDLVQMITAKRLGFPVSFKTLHQVARERGVTTLTFEEELQEIAKDPEELKAIMAMQGKDTGNDPSAASGGPAGGAKTKTEGNTPTE